jgi:hypothetical protein
MDIRMPIADAITLLILLPLIGAMVVLFLWINYNGTVISIIRDSLRCMKYCLRLQEKGLICKATNTSIEDTISKLEKYLCNSELVTEETEIPFSEPPET